MNWIAAKLLDDKFVCHDVLFNPESLLVATDRAGKWVSGDIGKMYHSKPVKKIKDIHSATPYVC
ncbi:hypothetical protein ERJ77_18755, partial [Vibrio anguillarum]|nr:hypothetical protein [Vibrio anguillarum]